MKTFLRILVLAVATGVAWSFAPAARAAAFVSPTNNWDFIMTGKQRGIAFISFSDSSDSNTVTGFEILRPRPFKSSQDARHPVGENARGGIVITSGETNAPNSTNFTGSAKINGLWAFDFRGRVVGVFSEISQSLEDVVTVTTNQMDGTNVVSTNTVTMYVTHTNGVSFRAVLNSSGTRMTLQAYTDRGLSTFRGVQKTDLPDIDGDFYAFGRKFDQPFIDFFTLVQDPIPNSYTITNGFGSGYITLQGRALVSKHRQIAIITIRDMALLSVYVGPFNIATRRGSLIGTDTVHQHIPYRIAPRTLQ